MLRSYFKCVLSASSRACVRAAVPYTVGTSSALPQITLTNVTSEKTTKESDLDHVLRRSQDCVLSESIDVSYRRFMD